MSSKAGSYLLSSMLQIDRRSNIVGFAFFDKVKAFEYVALAY